MCLMPILPVGGVAKLPAGQRIDLILRFWSTIRRLGRVGARAVFAYPHKTSVSKAALPSQNECEPQKFHPAQLNGGDSLP